MTLPRLIVCSANRHSNGLIICGARHCDGIMHAQRKAAGYAAFGGEWTQGFIDQRGVFLSRNEAWKVAEAAGQIRRRVGGDAADGGTLYSENVW